jgi:hypothetical protein
LSDAWKNANIWLFQAREPVDAPGGEVAHANDGQSGHIRIN